MFRDSWHVCCTVILIWFKLTTLKRVNLMPKIAQPSERLTIRKRMRLKPKTDRSLCCWFSNKRRQCINGFNTKNEKKQRVRQVISIAELVADRTTPCGWRFTTLHASFKLLNLNYKKSLGLDACKGAVSGELCHDVCSCAVPRRRSNGFLNRVLLNTYAKVRGISLELWTTDQDVQKFKNAQKALSFRRSYTIY